MTRFVRGRIIIVETLDRSVVADKKKKKKKKSLGYRFVDGTAG